MSDFPITIYHNPACGTSRNTLALLRESGHEPTVVEYLKAGWTKEALRDLAARAGVPIRALIRTRGTPVTADGVLRFAGAFAAGAAVYVVQRGVDGGQRVVAKGVAACSAGELEAMLATSPVPATVVMMSVPVTDPAPAASTATQPAVHSPTSVRLTFRPPAGAGEAPPSPRDARS